MIISASRRTDIPAFYSQWMANRLREGHVLVPYPKNSGKIGSIHLTPENVDCIMFWTKNPATMLGQLDAIDALGFRYYFSFTITGYGQDIERSLPPKDQVIDTFLRLSKRLGPKQVDWRFDPIQVNSRYSVEWHLNTFGEMCRRLQGATERCIMNFIKSYRHLPHIKELDDTVIRRVAEGMVKIAAEYHIPLYNCTEVWDLRDLGLHYSSCIDKIKIEEICGYPIRARKDPGQPSACRCIQSIDIGMYDTCANGCSYCYALTGEAKMRARMAAHDPESPLLTGHPQDEVVTDRTRPSQREEQLKLY